MSTRQKILFGFVSLMLLACVLEGAGPHGTGGMRAR